MDSKLTRIISLAALVAALIAIVISVANIEAKLKYFDARLDNIEAAK